MTEIDIGQINFHLDCIKALLAKKEDTRAESDKLENYHNIVVPKRSAEVEYQGCEWLSIAEMARLTFEHFGYTNESPMLMNNFLTAQMKFRRLLDYRTENRNRVYRINGKEKQPWLKVAQKYMDNPNAECLASDINFYKEHAPELWWAVWGDRKENFAQAYINYKSYIEGNRK